MGRLLASPKAFGLSGQFARKALRLLPHGLTHAGAFNAWAVARELPEPPRQSFREWYRQQPQPVAQPELPQPQVPA